MSNRRVAIKVDCDTFLGSKTGLPALLKLFDRTGIRASFFFTLGPDRSGRAIRRVFTHKGFLQKMLRSNAVSLYPTKTMLYGTLLPAPMIGQKAAAEIRAVGEAGHDVGVHGWDHVRWHDRLDRLSSRDVERDYGNAHRVFESIMGRKARSSAAPGWHATAASLALQDRYGLHYASDTRGGTPFFPSIDGRAFQVLQIPTTLPTWDEMLGDPRFRDTDALLDHYRSPVEETDVHTIHTEVEGSAYLPLFERLLARWKADGAAFVTLAQIADEALARRTSLPVRQIVRVAIPNRGGLVTASCL